MTCLETITLSKHFFLKTQILKPKKSRAIPDGSKSAKLNEGVDASFIANELLSTVEISAFEVFMNYMNF